MDGDHLTLLNVYHAYKQHNESKVRPSVDSTHVCVHDIYEYMNVRLTHDPTDHHPLKKTHPTHTPKPQDWCWENFVNSRSMGSAENVRQQLERMLKRMEVALVSPDFNSPDYYTQIKKALTAGGYMQVGGAVCVRACVSGCMESTARMATHNKNKNTAHANEKHHTNTPNHAKTPPRWRTCRRRGST